MIVALMSVFAFQDVHFDVTWYCESVFALCFNVDGCVANVAVAISMVVVVITVVIMVVIVIVVVIMVVVVIVVVITVVIMVVSMVVVVIIMVIMVVMIIAVVVMVITMLITVVMVMVMRSAHLQSSHVERLFFVVAFKLENVFTFLKFVYVDHSVSGAAVDFSE